MKKYVIVLSLISVFCLAGIFMIKEKENLYTQNNDDNIEVQEIIDFTSSIWYSEETGYFIDFGDGDYEEKQGTMSVSTGWYTVFCDGSKYRLCDRNDNFSGSAEENTFAECQVDVLEDGKDVFRKLSDFSPLGPDLSKSRKKIKKILGENTEIMFQKYPSQNFYDYPDSVWKSEETGYTLRVPDQDTLDEQEIAELDVEYFGQKEKYMILNEKLYTMPVWAGMCYEIKEESDGIDFDMYFSVLIYKQDGDLYMRWFDMGNSDTVNKINKKKNRELFTKYDEIVFRKV